MIESSLTGSLCFSGKRSEHRICRFALATARYRRSWSFSGSVRRPAVESWRLRLQVSSKLFVVSASISMSHSGKRLMMSPLQIFLNILQ